MTVDSVPPNPDTDGRVTELLADWRGQAERCVSGTLGAVAAAQMLVRCADELEAALAATPAPVTPPTEYPEGPDISTRPTPPETVPVPRADDHDGHTINLGAPSSPVPSRPDTARLRSSAGWMRDWAQGPDRYDHGWGEAIFAAADWIDAQPAADQGPDLSELAARIEALLLTDGPDGMAHWIYAPEWYATDEYPEDDRWTDEMVEDFRRVSAGSLAKKLAAALADREGGN